MSTAVSRQLGEWQYPLELFQDGVVLSAWLSTVNCVLVGFPPYTMHKTGKLSAGQSVWACELCSNSASQLVTRCYENSVLWTLGIMNMFLCGVESH